MGMSEGGAYQRAATATTIKESTPGVVMHTETKTNTYSNKNSKRHIRMNEGGADQRAATATYIKENTLGAVMHTETNINKHYNDQVRPTQKQGGRARGWYRQPI